MAQGDFVQTVEGEDVQVLPINGVDYVSVTDAVAISDFSRAYINKLLNSDKIAGMQLPGLGWLVSIDSLKEFASTNRRAPGKQTMLDQALKLYLEGLGDGVFQGWEAVKEQTLAAYKQQKAESGNGDDDDTEEDEE